MLAERKRELQIVLDRALDEHGPLVEIHDFGAERGHVATVDCPTLPENLTFVHGVESRQSAQQHCLTGTTRPGQSEPVASPHDKRHVAQQRRLLGTFGARDANRETVRKR